MRKTPHSLLFRILYHTYVLRHIEFVPDALLVLLMTIITTQLNTVRSNVTFCKSHASFLNMSHCQLCQFKMSFHMNSMTDLNRNEIFVFNLFLMPNATSSKPFSIKYSLRMCVCVCSCFFGVGDMICWCVFVFGVSAFDWHAMAYQLCTTVQLYIHTKCKHSSAHRFMHFIEVKWLMNTCTSDDSLQFACISMWINNTFSPSYGFVYRRW